MGASQVNPSDYAKPKQPECFVEPLDEADRFSGFEEAHAGPERRSSGNLPDQPVGLEVDATPGNPRPFRVR
jgi:hypothetical protein